MLKPAVIDISHHQTIPASLKPAVESGIIGVIHKATEGTSYVDSKLEARAFLAADAGALFGVYHFVRPGDMLKQARHFVSVAAAVADHRTLYALDWEVDGLSIDDAATFLKEVQELTGHEPVIYSGHTIKEELNGKPSAVLSRYRLWLAHYASAPTLPPGWDKYYLWQFTDRGECPGINPPVDLNAFDGTAEELAADWARCSEAVPPKPGPPVDQVGMSLALLN